MTLEVRPIEGEQELREFARVHATAFGHRWEDDKLENVILPWLPEVHAIAAFDGDTMVGASVDQPFEMTLPGGRMAPMRGITWVGVLPTHRGRGALRAMIEHQHASFREQGLAFGDDDLWALRLRAGHRRCNRGRDRHPVRPVRGAVHGLRRGRHARGAGALRRRAGGDRPRPPRDPG
jgi:hypothetical protein